MIQERVGPSPHILHTHISSQVVSGGGGERIQGGKKKKEEMETLCYTQITHLSHTFTYSHTHTHIRVCTHRERLIDSPYSRRNVPFLYKCELFAILTQKSRAPFVWAPGKTCAHTHKIKLHLHPSLFSQCSLYGPKITHELWPPKPNEFEMAAVTSNFCFSCGTVLMDTSSRSSWLSDGCR